MKLTIALIAALFAWIMMFGSPFVGDEAAIDHFYGSPELILPMTFAHVDHTTVSCVDCHHNYVDDTGNEPCMYCHVTEMTVAPLLEDQFHTLCRGCHEDLARHDEAGGPPRQCIACHQIDQLP